MALNNVGQQILENAARQGTGIMSTRPNARFITGARCILKVNNQLFGFAFNISWRIHTDVAEIRTIDDYMPHEFAPTMIHVDGTIGAFRIPGRGPTAEFQQASILSFPFHKYITIEVRDEVTNSLLFYTDRAVITTRAEDISNDRLSTVQLQWKAIGWKDDLELAGLPVNANTTSDQKGGSGNAVNDAINGAVGKLNGILR